ncbi:MAG: hypothetical protein LC803_20455 [Acidobacteria bacterium]|nr:hypothetical protein [Acidobacteriota bacterium]
MAMETRLVCQEQRRLLALQQERALLLTRGIEEARLALAMQMSEMTELRAHLEETRHRLSKLRPTLFFID